MNRWRLWAPIAASGLLTVVLGVLVGCSGKAESKTDDKPDGKPEAAWSLDDLLNHFESKGEKVKSRTTFGDRHQIAFKSFSVEVVRCADAKTAMQEAADIAKDQESEAPVTTLRNPIAWKNFVLCPPRDDDVRKLKRFLGLK